MRDRVFNIVSTIVIIIGIVVGIGVSAIIGCPAIIFIICLVTEDAGKLDSVEKIFLNMIIFVGAAVMIIAKLRTIGITII